MHGAKKGGENEERKECQTSKGPPRRKQTNYTDKADEKE